VRDYEESVRRLKNARNHLLDLHKLLIDSEKAILERDGSSITPGQFLGLLMNDEKFEWLRSISRLVVRIDESFELDDGMPEELLGKLSSEVLLLVDESDENEQFKQRIEVSLMVMPEAKAKRDHIKKLFE
jgi:hypothetical protein